MEAFCYEAKKFESARTKADVHGWERFLKAFKQLPEAPLLCLEIVSRFPNHAVGLIAAQTLKDICRKANQHAELLQRIVPTVCFIANNLWTSRMREGHPVIHQLTLAISLLFSELSAAQRDFASCDDYGCHLSACVVALVNQLVSASAPQWLTLQILAVLPEHYPQRLPSLTERTVCRLPVNVQSAGCFLTATPVVAQYCEAAFANLPSQPPPFLEQSKVVLAYQSWLKLLQSVAAERGGSLPVVQKCLDGWHRNGMNQVLDMLRGWARYAVTAASEDEIEGAFQIEGICAECLSLFCMTVDACSETGVETNNLFLASIASHWLSQLAHCIDLLNNVLKQSFQVDPAEAKLRPAAAAVAMLFPSLAEAAGACLRTCKKSLSARASCSGEGSNRGDSDVDPLTRMLIPPIEQLLDAIQKQCSSLAAEQQRLAQCAGANLSLQSSVQQLCFDILVGAVDIWKEAAGLAAIPIVQQHLAHSVLVVVHFSNFTSSALRGHDSPHPNNAIVQPLWSQSDLDEYLERLGDYRQDIRDYLREISRPWLGRVVLEQLFSHYEKFARLYRESSQSSSWPDSACENLESWLHALTAIPREHVLCNESASSDRASLRVVASQAISLASLLCSDLCMWCRPTCRMSVLLATELLSFLFTQCEHDILKEVLPQWVRMVKVAMMHGEATATLHDGSTPPEFRRLFMTTARLPFRLKQDHIGCVCVAKVVPQLARYLGSAPTAMVLNQVWSGDAPRMEDTSICSVPLLQRPGYSQGCLQTGLIHFSLALLTSQVCQEPPAFAPWVSWKSYSIVFLACSRLMVMEYLLRDGTSLWSVYAPLLAALVPQTTLTKLPLDSSPQTLKRFYQARCPPDLLLSCLLQLCCDLDDMALQQCSAKSLVSFVPGRVLSACEVVVEVLTALVAALQESPVRSPAVSVAESLSPKARESLLRIFAYVTHLLAGVGASAFSLLLEVVRGYCICVSSLVPCTIQYAHLILADMLQLALSSPSSVDPQYLVTYFVQIVGFGHQAVSLPIASALAMPNRVYQGLDVGLERDSDKTVERQRQNRRVHPALPAHIVFVASALAMTDLAGKDAYLSHQSLPPNFLASISQACYGYLESGHYSVEVCRGLVSIVDLLGGPVLLAPISSADLWECKIPCTEGPMGHAHLLQWYQECGGLRSMVRTLLHLLIYDAHSELRDLVCRTFGRLCCCFGAGSFLQTVLHVLVEDLQEPAENARKTCSQAFNACLAGHWKKLRPLLKSLVK